MVVALALFGLVALMIPGYLARALNCTPGSVSESSREIVFCAPTPVLLLLLIFEGLRRKVNPIKRTSFFISCASFRACGLAPFWRGNRSGLHEHPPLAGVRQEPTPSMRFDPCTPRFHPSPKLKSKSGPTDKQNDGNDGAGQLLYHTLVKEGADAWFDKFATDRSTEGMLEGVGGCACSLRRRASAMGLLGLPKWIRMGTAALPRLSHNFRAAHAIPCPRWSLALLDTPRPTSEPC